MKKNPILIFGDTETSGLSVEDKIVQIAYSYKETPKTFYGTNFFIKGERISVEELTNPGIPITPEAAMTTGIDDVHVKDALPFTKTQSYSKLKKLVKEDNTYFVFYNAPFDIDMLEKDGLFIPADRVLDLYRVVKHIYKDKKILNRNNEEVPLSNNKMQYFRYLLKFDEKEDFKKLVKEYGQETIQAHTALSDVIVMEYFYNYIMKEFNLSFEEMIELSNTPVLEPFITFGNVFEKGTPYEQCLTVKYEQWGKMKNGYDYLDWCSNTLTLSVDTSYSIKIHFFNHLVNGDIPYKETFAKYVNFGLVFEKDEEKIKKALKLIKQEDRFVDLAKTKFMEKLENEVEELIEAELSDRFPSLFLLKYMQKKQNEEKQKKKEKEESLEDIVVDEMGEIMSRIEHG